MTVKQIFSLVVGIAILVVLVAFSGSIFENVPADEIVVIQDMVDGELHWNTTPGLKAQWFGRPTHYKKSFQYWFSLASDQGGQTDQSIKIRFNDGGHASVSGSVRCDLPLDEASLTNIHTKFGSQAAIEHELIRPVFEKAVYMTGPLFSSKESYAEKRTQLISLIEDQATKGVYKTSTKDVRGTDPMTGIEKTITLVEFIKDEKAPGGLAREEESPLATFNIKSYNLSINGVQYDPTVEEQIKQQQKAIMDVQTAVANAKKAEQDAITAEKNGQAGAAKAKWDQEIIKAQKVTEAQQGLAVAELNKQEAEQIKLKNILLGEGEAERKKLVMAADGALEQKLAAWKEAQKYWAENLPKANPGALVPYLVMGGGGQSGNFSASDWMSLIGAKMARDLSLDMSLPKGQQTDSKK